ncbi:MAG TPA: dienelactone hydrolase family protein, partial [Planctomycetaceae bacterium]
ALPAATPEEAESVKGRILVNHGAADSFVPEQAVRAFREPLQKAGVPLTIKSYPGAKHGFTVPGAEEKGLEGLAYDRKADEQSWQAMRDLFEETLGKNAAN